MTTSMASEIRRPAPPHWPGTVAIPLAEFSKSLDNADLGEWFQGFAARNFDMGEYEISSSGHLLIREATGSPGSVYEVGLVGDLLSWAGRNGGITFGPSGCFVLPDGSHSGPDAAWIREEQRREVILPENRPFPRIVPDFIAELKSPSHRRAELVAKISQFLEHGTRSAWYIDGETRIVIKFRTGSEPETLRDAEYIDGNGDALPGFRFAVRERIFDLFADAEYATLFKRATPCKGAMPCHPT